MNRNACQFAGSVAVLLLASALAVGRAQAVDTPPPQELLHYVQEARKSGVKDDKIKQQALSAGWPPAVVDQAIAYDHSDKSGKPSKQTKPAASAPKDAAATFDPPIAATQPAALSGAAINSPAPGAKSPAANPAGVPSDSGQDYQIAIGDTLQVNVWQRPEVSVATEIVRPDGKISMPLIKDFEVAGLTPPQVEKRVAELLSKYYTDANVAVTVIATAPKKVYVTGGVKKEGPIPYSYGMRVMQAISEAGGLTDYAKRKKIYILHTENGREYRLDFNYEEVMKGVRMEQNVQLVPGDTVVVPN